MARGPAHRAATAGRAQKRPAPGLVTRGHYPQGSLQEDWLAFTLPSGSVMAFEPRGWSSAFGGLEFSFVW